MRSHRERMREYQLHSMVVVDWTQFREIKNQCAVNCTPIECSCGGALNFSKPGEKSFVEKWMWMLQEHCRKLIRLQKVNCFQIAMFEGIIWYFCETFRYYYNCRCRCSRRHTHTHTLFGMQYKDRHTISYAIKNLYQVEAEEKQKNLPQYTMNMPLICSSI